MTNQTHQQEKEKKTKQIKPLLLLEQENEDIRLLLTFDICLLVLIHKIIAVLVVEQHVAA